jgi:hypothetical protein
MRDPQAGRIGPLPGHHRSQGSADQEGGSQPGHEDSLHPVHSAPQQVTVGPQPAQPPAAPCHARYWIASHLWPLAQDPASWLLRSEAILLPCRDLGPRG